MTDPEQMAEKFWRGMAQMSEEDRQKLNRAPIETSQPPKPKGKVTYLGLLPDDDPIYTEGGWNFIMGKNLNPKIK